MKRLLWASFSGQEESNVNLWVTSKKKQRMRRRKEKKKRNYRCSMMKFVRMDRMEDWAFILKLVRLRVFINRNGVGEGNKIICVFVYNKIGQTSFYSHIISIPPNKHNIMFTKLNGQRKSNNKFHKIVCVFWLLILKCTAVGCWKSSVAEALGYWLFYVSNYLSEDICS